MANMNKINNENIHTFLFRDENGERRQSKHGYNKPRPRKDVVIKVGESCKIPTCQDLADGREGLCQACDHLGLGGNYEMYVAFLDEGMSRHQAMSMAGLNDLD